MRGVPAANLAILDFGPELAASDIGEAKSSEGHGRFRQSEQKRKRPLARFWHRCLSSCADSRPSEFQNLVSVMDRGSDLAASSSNLALAQRR
jgi:hypothetical protein